MRTYLLENHAYGVSTTLSVINYDGVNVYAVTQNNYNNPNVLPFYMEAEDMDEALSWYYTLLCQNKADCEPVMLTDYVNNGFHIVAERDNAGYVISCRNMNDGAEVTYRTLNRDFALVQLEDWCEMADKAA